MGVAGMVSCDSGPHEVGVTVATVQLSGVELCG